MKMKNYLLIAIAFMFVCGAAVAQDKKTDPAKLSPAPAAPASDKPSPAATPAPVMTPAATPAGIITTPAAAPVTPPPANPNAGDFKFNEEEFNFGTIKQGDAATHEFTFVNVGKEPIIITSAQGSCGCTVPTWPKEPIAKGEKSVIKVTFNSAGKMGMQDKTVTIQSNAKTNPKVIHMKGNVEAPPKAPETAPATVPATPAAEPKKEIK